MWANIRETNASDKRSTNLYQKLVQETCMKNLTQVHHSFLHNNNSPANHVAQFVSRAEQFLSCVAFTSAKFTLRLAKFSELAEDTIFSINLYKTDQCTCMFLVQVS